MNDLSDAPSLKLRMARPKRTIPDQQYRIHFIPEWAAARDLTQADIVRAIGVDKANVSRWFSGAIPREEHIDALAVLFHLENRRDIFRHPKDDWMLKFFNDRSEEELERIRATLEAAFPKKRA